MVDEEIIALYWQRDELAIEQTKMKYGKYCRTIAFNILGDGLDAEECENDTYMAAWHAIPPERPESLVAYLGRIVRNLALKKLRHRKTIKRGGEEVMLSYEELQECLPDNHLF